MADTLTVLVGGSTGTVTQQSAVGAAQDLNSMQLFLPHLKCKSGSMLHYYFTLPPEHIQPDFSVTRLFAFDS